MLRRRDFLKTAGFLPFLPSGVFAQGLGRANADQRSLVLLELTGGNDGLNTVVPFRDPLYRRARPTLAHAETAVHRLDEATALAPALPELAKIFHAGRLAIVQGVGMNPVDRSHFVSLDRWHLGRMDAENGGLGWLATHLDRGEAPPFVSGMTLGDRSVPRLFRGAPDPVLASQSLEDLLPDATVRTTMKSKALAELDSIWGEPEERRHAREARALLVRLESVMARKKTRALSDSALGRQLHDVATIIEEGLSVPAFLVRFSGFDTHSRQGPAHQALLSTLDDALPAFLDRLRKSSAGRQTLVVVYSEFGRRVEENGTQGTDHGAAGPVFLAGPEIPAGLHGSTPDLSSLVEGDLVATVDYRRILGCALRHLGCRDPKELLGSAARPLFT